MSSIITQNVKEFDEKLNEIRKMYVSNLSVVNRIECLKEGMLIAYQAQSRGWIVKGDRIVYTKTIYAKKIKYDNTIVEIPEGYETQFYCINLYILFEDIKSDLTVSKALVEDSYHPNISREEKIVCLGDLENKPLLIVLDKLPALLEVVNLDSCYEDDPQIDAEDLFINADKENLNKLYVFTASGWKEVIIDNYILYRRGGLK